MRVFQPSIALLCVLLTVAPFAGAQSTTPIIREPNSRFGFLHKYEPVNIAPIDLTNSPRLDALLRGGKLYLSLQDAIALTLENNLDIAVQRYGPLEAQADLQRAKSGGALRGVNQNITAGPSGAGGLSLNAFSGGASSTSGTSSVNGVNGIISQLGPSVPNYDPVLQGTLSWGHTTSLQTSSFLFAQNSVLSNTSVANFAVTQGFGTGAQYQISYNSAFQNQNTGRLAINPNITGSVNLFVTQPLLQGFGLPVNRRFIRQAKNALKVQDYVFKEQVISTVSNIVSLYWDLVSFNEQVRVAQQALATSQKLYTDNQKQVEIGTLAPISIVQAEAEVATREQDLTVAETNVLQQETIIKNQLSRNGVSSPAVAEARIVPLDHIRIPDVEPVEPIQDLVGKALAARPEISQSRLNIDSTKLTILGDRNSLLPAVNAFVSLTNNAQVGQANSIPQPDGQGGFVQNTPDPFFVGGFGSFLGQIFSRNFPDYRVGVQLSIPLRNRAAQADYTRDVLTLRQNELSFQKQINQIRVDVQNALIALQQARARYQAAVKGRVLEEQTLDAEQKKLALGASVIYNVIQIQRDLANAQGNEVTAESAYIKARNNLDFALGQTLDVNGIDMDEAYRGQVTRPPSAIPVLDQARNPAATTPTKASNIR
jgi:outer membrane protein